VVKRCNASLAIVAIVNIPRSEVLEDARGSGISPGTACGRSLVRCIQNQLNARNLLYFSEIFCCGLVSSYFHYTRKHTLYFDDDGGSQICN
jgi:hypothetical protein